MISRTLTKRINRTIFPLQYILDNHRHYTFIFRRNKLLSVGHNSTLTHPLAQRFGCLAIHAELKAIQLLDNKEILPKCKVINVRINKRGQFRLSSPCQSCCKLLSYLGVQQVYYSTSQGRYEKLLLKT